MVMVCKYRGSQTVQTVHSPQPANRIALTAVHGARLAVIERFVRHILVASPFLVLEQWLGNVAFEIIRYLEALKNGT